jgi:hypothetical protein
MISARRSLLHQMPNGPCDEVFPLVDSTPLVLLGPPHPPLPLHEQQLLLQMLLIPIVKLGFAQSIERGIYSAHHQLLLHRLPSSPVSTPQPPLSLLDHVVVPRLRLVL